MNNKKVIDLFAGCGGFSLGFEKCNYQIVKAVEFDQDIAKTYKENHKHTQLFVTDIGKIDNQNYFRQGEVDVIIGGPPCQGFSMAGARIRKTSFIEDPRNYLFKHYVNVVKIVKPKVFLFENVKGILSMKDGEIFKEILSALSNKENFDGEQYNLYHYVINAVDYGVPEKRQRVFILGVKNKNIEFNELDKKCRKKILNKYPHFFDYVSVGDAICGLEKTTEDGVVSNLFPKNEYQKYLLTESKETFNHNKTKHKLSAIDRMKKIRVGENFSVLKENIKSVHSGAYGRMDPNKPSMTITTRFDTPSGGRFIHPTENRTITAREAARIQSFPDNFRFYGSKTSICKQIGNAVPPKLAFYCASLIEEILDND